MKKYTLLSTLLFVAFISSHAQEFTVRLAGGYAGPGFQNNENVLGPKVDPATPTTDGLVNLANINDSAHTYKPVHGSYGTGGNVTLAVGYMFNNYIGIDVGVGYGHSNDISCNQVREQPGFSPPVFLYANINSFSYAVTLTPAIVVSGAKTGWKVYPYGRLGLVLPVAGKLTDNVTIDANTLSGISPVSLNQDRYGWLGNYTHVTLVTEGTLSLGISGAVGVAYRPLPFLSVFAELNGQYLQVRGKSSTITKWDATIIQNGTTTTVSDLAARGTYRTQFSYVDQLSPQSNNAAYNANYNPNQPKQDLRPTSPGSNLGFNVGVTFFLSKKTLKKQDKDIKK